ncbi:hypothetical protein ACP4OV_001070 [Aristida adscensionis]
MEKNGYFLSSALVSSILGGLEEEDKNANTAERRRNLCFLYSPLSGLVITLAFILHLPHCGWLKIAILLLTPEKL